MFKVSGGRVKVRVRIKIRIILNLDDSDGDAKIVPKKKINLFIHRSCVLVPRTLWDTVSLAGWRGSWGDNRWTPFRLDAGCHWLESSYTSTNTSMHLDINENSNIINYTVYPSNGNMILRCKILCVNPLCAACWYILSVAGQNFPLSGPKL